MSAPVIPIAARLGFTHVSVAQLSSGEWHCVIWSEDGGPTPLAGDGTYGSAVEQAKVYGAKRPGVIVSIPCEYRTMDVLRSPDGGFWVQEMSMGEGSAAILQTFGPHQREGAVRFALDNLAHFSPCRLGRVEE